MEYIKGENRYYVVDGDKEIAEITYSTDGENILIIDHTAVDSNYRGQKIAETLVKLVVDQAIVEGKEIVPLCPYAAKVFSRKVEYQKIQKKEM
ncbi:MAG: N-acetyltransferase [Erysipelotrichaceae bacterium]|nr:N-acetyltransferase [Erysipelotrichaceae bacterium]